MKNDVFVRYLLSFLNIILKSVGLAPFSYSKSRMLFVQCKLSTILSFVISGFIIAMSLPIEILSAMHFKPHRSNTITYSIGYLHIFFTVVKIWLNQILTITNRHKIIRHLNQAFYINAFLRDICNKEEHLLDDQLVRKIKLRILLFILQSLAILYGVNAYISRSFFIHQASLLVRTFICFSYINAILVTTVYLSGSLMLSDRYCRVLCCRVQVLIGKITGTNECSDNLKLYEQLHQILRAYDDVVTFAENSQNLFASHAVICACSTFIVTLHGSFTLYCTVRSVELIQINKLVVDILYTACYFFFKFTELIFIISLSSEVKGKIEKLHYLIQRTPRFVKDGLLIDEIGLQCIQMQQEKPIHSFCGIFAFDRNFFFSVVVTIISYLIILIQLDIAAVDSKAPF